VIPTGSQPTLARPKRLQIGGPAGSHANADDRRRSPNNLAGPAAQRFFEQRCFSAGQLMKPMPKAISSVASTAVPRAVARGLQLTSHQTFFVQLWLRAGQSMKPISGAPIMPSESGYGSQVQTSSLWPSGDLK
jgi:hypothetical protein